MEPAERDPSGIGWSRAKPVNPPRSTLASTRVDDEFLTFFRERWRLPDQDDCRVAELHRRTANRKQLRRSRVAASPRSPPIIPRTPDAPAVPFHWLWRVGVALPYPWPMLSAAFGTALNCPYLAQALDTSRVGSSRQVCTTFSRSVSRNGAWPPLWMRCTPMSGTHSRCVRRRMHGPGCGLVPGSMRIHVAKSRLQECFCPFVLS